MEATLLEKHLGDKEVRNLIESNLEELGKLQDLANSLLELARLHKKDDNFVDVISLTDVIQSAYKKVAPMAKKKHITFVISPVGGKVKGNKQSLIEVFVNLFDNAIKYSHSRTTVSVTSKLRKHASVISIMDQGIGIAADDLTHIFDRFYRVDKSRSQADGHGLGLSIAKKIIAAHDGSIDVESTLKKGTVFTITLPLVS
jgi:signal transduction histidine kinase